MNFNQQQATYRSINQIEGKFIDIINDKSFEQTDKKKQKFKTPFPNILQYLKVFECDSKLMILFKILTLILILCQLLWIPLQISFKVEPGTAIKFILYDFSSCLFVFAIFFHFNTTIYIDGNVIYDRKTIARSYLKETFIVDFITTLALILQDQISFSEIQYIFILRIPQVMTLEKSISSSLLTKQLFNVIHLYDINIIIMNRSQKYITYYELIKLISFLLCVAHFCACGFYVVGYTSSNQNWIIKNKMENEPWYTIYVACLYFSIITMNTVGYGDLTPINTQERIYVLIMIIISCGIFGYSINTIGEIIRSSQQKYESFRQVSKDLTIKVVRQLEYITSQESFSNGEYVLEKLNRQLQEEVKMEYFGKIILHNLLFKKIFSQQFLEKLCLKMKDMKKYFLFPYYKISLYPNEILEKIGSKSERLYFVYKGIINQVVEYDIDQVVDSINTGSILGFQNFFCNLPYEYTLKSQNVTSLIFCEYSDFKELLQQFPDDNEQFCLLRDTILQNIQSDLVTEKCLCCKQFTHSTFRCPCLTIIPNRSLIIKRYSFSALQKRSYQDRKKTKYSCLKNLDTIKQSLKKCRIDQILKFQVGDEDDLILLQQDTQQIQQLEDKLFFKTIPLIKFLAVEVLRNQMDTSQGQDEDETDDHENQIDEDAEDRDTNMLQSENSSAVLKKSQGGQQSIYEQIKKRNDEHGNKLKEADNQLKMISSFGQIAPYTDSKRRISLEDFQDNEVFGKFQKNQKKMMNSEKNTSNPDIPSSKNVSSFKDVIHPQGQNNSVINNNLGSNMSAYTPSLNTKMPSQQSNYVHYNKKRNQKKQIQNISTNQIQSSKMLIDNGSFKQLSYNFIQQPNQTMNQSQGTTIHNPSTFHTQTKIDLYTRDTQNQENMNPFENQLDRQKEFKIYFPNFNVEKVLNGLKKKLLQFQKMNRMKKYQEDTLTINKKSRSIGGDPLSKSARSPQLMALMQQLRISRQYSNIDVIKL